VIHEAQLAREVVFTTQGDALESASTFRCLGRPLSVFDEDWPAAHHNLKKTRQRWARVSRVLTRDGADPRVCSMFYKAVAQSVLLYCCETWVVTPRVLKVLEGFHHRVARRLSGMRPRYLPREDRWDYPPLEEAMEKAGLYSVQHCIGVRQNTLADNVATRPILELSMEAERQSGSSRRLFWWNQEGLVDRFNWHLVVMPR